MPYTTEIKMGYEPSFQELMNSDLTQLAMASDRVERSHVEKIASRAAEAVNNNRRTR